MNAICVDDELPSLQLIETYCRETGLVTLVRSFSDPKEVPAFLKQNKIDLLILDIQMPGLSGIELLQQAGQDYLCLFVTADPSHALTAYELDVIDYLVKPVTPERFKKALQKAADYQQYKQAPAPAEQYLMFKADYMIQKVKLEDIFWVEGSGEYIKIISRFRQYTILQRLSDFVEKYQHFGFIRIHKSFVVLREQIKSYNASSVFLNNAQELPVGRTYKENLKG